MAKILIAGGAGFKGSRVVKLFASQGYEIVVVGDLSSVHVSNLNLSAGFRTVDVRDSGEKQV